MNRFIVTIILAILIIIILYIIASKLKLTEYMNSISDKVVVGTAAIYIIVLLFGGFIIFGAFDNFSDREVAIFGYILLFNFLISLTLSKFILALYYKKTNHSIKSLKLNKEYEEIREREQQSRRKQSSAIVRKNINKLEKEKDFNYLNSDEKELVRKGDYEPFNFEYPEDHENLDEDDFYSEDDHEK